jgi:hypothetical protein
MITKAVISVSGSNIGRETVDRLFERFPDYREGRLGWKIEGLLESDEIQEVLAWLEAHGAKPVATHGRHPSHFDLELQRVYSADELAGFSWFIFESLSDDKVLGSFGTDRVLEVEKSSILKPVRLAKVAGGRDLAVVSRRFREHIEAAGIKGTIFKEARVVDRRGRASSGELWELTSESLFPPLLSPPVKFKDASVGEPYQGDPKRGILPDDGCYSPPALYYRKSDCQGLADTDCALTFERFGIPTIAAPWMLFSSRFRDFAVAEGVSGMWYPVYLQ